MDYKELSKILPMSRDISILNKPLTIQGKNFFNRLAVQPMEGADGTAEGAPDELCIRRYERFAGSGAGLIWFEAVAVREDGRANPRQLWMHKDNLDDFKRIVLDIKETAYKKSGFAPVLIMQATHSGRYSKNREGRFAPLIACNNPVLEKEALPQSCIITDDEIRRIEEKYGVITRFAINAGFDGIDIKACHRYLNNELLSAVTRPGPYGGSLENRMRFFKNCVLNARDIADKDFIVTARINIYDGIEYPYGFGVEEEGLAPDLSEPIEVIKQLQFPLLNITMGNPYYNPQVNRPRETGGVVNMYNCTKQIKDAFPELPVVSSAPTFLRENSPYLAAGAVEQRYADLVGFGRMAFAYPDFARDSLEDAFDKKQTCVACGNCSVLMRRAYAGCMVRDPVYTEIFKKLMEEDAK